jgi:uncharacterized protein YukE
MEHTLAQQTMLLPSFLLAFFIVVYRNSIFSFQYNSTNLVSNQMMKNITTMIESKALVVQQESNYMLVRSLDLLYAMIETLKNGVLMIVANIQGMCAAIYQSVQNKMYVTTEMLHNIFDSIVTNIESIKNTTTNYFTPAPKPFYEYIYTPLLILVSSAILAITIYYLHNNRVIQPGDTIPETIVLENTIEPVAETKKKLVRRRASNC